MPLSIEEKGVTSGPAARQLTVKTKLDQTHRDSPHIEVRGGIREAERQRQGARESTFKAS